MANKTFWNAENRARLDAMVRKGALLVSLEKAAEILGTSFSTVHAEITRRGIKPSGRHTFEWTPARRKMLRAILDDEGKLILPRANAAKIIGCDRATLITGLIALEFTGSYTAHYCDECAQCARQARALQKLVGQNGDMERTRGGNFPCPREKGSGLRLRAGCFERLIVAR